MKIYIKSFMVFTLMTLISCNDDFLELRPKDKLDGEAMFADPAGVRTYMANLYYQLPIEDFLFFRSANAFNFNPGDANNSGIVPAIDTDNAIHSEHNISHGQGQYRWWDPAFKLIRDVNILTETIPGLSIEEEEKNKMIGESAFIKAYAYYALAKRYGGVPIIDELQKYEGNVEDLKIPRSTEKETWDYVMAKCDVAIENLPDEWPGGERRATKWVAYALKSRAALHAASVAKYWSKAPLSGTAVDLKLAYMDASDANSYYEHCIKASEAIMSSGKFSLFRPDPTSPEEAAENYRLLFEDPNTALEEVMFIKGWSLPGTNRGHNYDIWFSPNQVANGWPHPGRLNPTLELVDTYESYSNPGESSPVITTTDGNVNNYNGFDLNREYLRFETPYEIFKDKDARLWGTTVLPGTEFKGEEIIIQGGLVLPDGSTMMETKNSYEHKGTTYYTYGAPDWPQYSGFDTYGGNMTRTGFSFKKFLNSKQPIVPAWNQSTTDWIDFRYAEVLLNYAEAVVESGYSANNAQTKAANAINDLRKRAGHTVDISLTLENVLRERRVELAFENKRLWDLVRRRDFHTTFNNLVRHALVPLLDLRVDPPQYIFVRKQVSRESQKTFLEKFYYRPIDGVNSNELIQNPEY
jgi:starch-binding outer membrane protein, SusD/RagB family